MATRSTVPQPRSNATETVLQFPQTKDRAEKGRARPKRDNVTAFPTSHGTVSQEDLLEERILTGDAKKAIAKRDQKREWIRRNLELGVNVEDGPLKAELRPRLRSQKLHAVLSVYV